MQFSNTKFKIIFRRKETFFLISINFFFKGHTLKTLDFCDRKTSKLSDKNKLMINY